MSSDRAADARVVSRAVGTGAEVLARVTSRVRALREVDHPGVLVPDSVGIVGEDQVVVTAPWLDGVDLAELETRRGPLGAGECVWLGVRVAEALRALHGAGIAHGDVSPANVVIASGAVVLVDTVGGCLDDERGTVGFRAPERASGPSAAADAYSLGALLRWAVASRDTVMIEAWTAPLMVADPESRPPLDVAARALSSCARERAIEVPPRTELVSAVRARAAQRTERIASGRAWRARRAALRAGAGVAVAAAAVAGVVAVPRVVDATVSFGTPQASGGSIAGEASTGAAATPARAPVQSEPTSASAPRDPQASEPPASEPQASEPRQAPEQAAAELTIQRIGALADGDGDALLATVADGPLERETAELARRLDAGLTGYEGLAVEVGEVTVTSHTGDTSTATVSYEVTDHHIVTDEGTVKVAGYEQRVELELTWDGRWRVERARPQT